MMRSYIRKSGKYSLGSCHASSGSNASPPKKSELIIVRSHSKETDSKVEVKGNEASPDPPTLRPEGETLNAAVRDNEDKVVKKRASDTEGSAVAMPVLSRERRSSSSSVSMDMSSNHSSPHKERSLTPSHGQSPPNVACEIPLPSGVPVVVVYPLP